MWKIGGNLNKLIYVPIQICICIYVYVQGALAKVGGKRLSYKICVNTFDEKQPREKKITRHFFWGIQSHIRKIEILKILKK